MSKYLIYQSQSKFAKFLVLFVILLFSQLNFAQCPGSPPAGIDCIELSAQKEITAHSECRSVTNNHASGKAVMIPVQTAPEWTSFYTNPPTGVTVGVCAADPCNGKTIGQTCTGTTALYAGIFDGGKYMIMPSGCANSTSDPTCSGGTDTVEKEWNDNSSNWYDIPGITNILGANPQTPSSSSERGHYTTPLIAAITLAGQGGPHRAGRHCDNMVYGGYSDWYLPSKSELAYIYCKSTPADHDTDNPLENPNCGGSGPSGQLTGFAPEDYWSSTEASNSLVWIMSFEDGDPDVWDKDSERFVRCVRRY